MMYLKDGFLSWFPWELASWDTHIGALPVFKIVNYFCNDAASRPDEGLSLAAKKKQNSRKNKISLLSFEAHTYYIPRNNNPVHEMHFMQFLNNFRSPRYIIQTLHTQSVCIVHI